MQASVLILLLQRISLVLQSKLAPPTFSFLSYHPHLVLTELKKIHSYIHQWVSLFVGCFSPWTTGLMRTRSMAILCTSGHSAYSSLPASELDCYKYLLNKKMRGWYRRKALMGDGGLRQCHSACEIVPSYLWFCSYLNTTGGSWRTCSLAHSKSLIHIWINDLMCNERRNDIYRLFCCYAVCVFMVVDHTVLYHCPQVALLSSF